MKRARGESVKSLVGVILPEASSSRSCAPLIKADTLIRPGAPLGIHNDLVRQMNSDTTVALPVRAEPHSVVTCVTTSTLRSPQRPD